MEFRVMTFNIHHARGLDGCVSLERVLRLIRSAGPLDLIGLNEVDVCYGKRSGWLNQAEYFSQELKMDYLFSPSISSTTGYYGNLLLSKYPIREGKTHLITGAYAENRSFIECEVKINQHFIKTYVTHVSLSSVTQAIQMKQLSHHILEDQLENKHVLLMGDFNFSPSHFYYQKLTKQLKDVWKTLHPNKKGATFPSVCSFFRFDYIMITPTMEATSATLIKNSRIASDHLPLVATIKI
ncbi:endonuclease/exonuclease/phosphatase family protein [Caldalkalibacillus mannanilyticus]|uniref:endonuclease/exonuclease/phosphatase family protein n=1 Tax=Caldalkalibacillus mannanilyticus TaxID=1418 RepID=UPI0004688DBF|nr:endonuclease/exonuclease/phosphatase family protein [Caldalkalibacillus mannanilyticus]